MREANIYRVMEKAFVTALYFLCLFSVPPSMTIGVLSIAALIFYLVVR
jgi:hypothetical protein